MHRMSLATRFAKNRRCNAPRAKHRCLANRLHTQRVRAWLKGHMNRAHKRKSIRKVDRQPSIRLTKTAPQMPDRVGSHFDNRELFLGRAGGAAATKRKQREKTTGDTNNVDAQLAKNYEMCYNSGARISPPSKRPNSGGSKKSLPA